MPYPHQRRTLLSLRVALLTVVVGLVAASCTEDKQPAAAAKSDIRGGTLLPADMNLLAPNNGQTVMRGTPGAVDLTSTGQQVVNPLAPQPTGPQAVPPAVQQATPLAPITQNVGSANGAAPGVIPSVGAQPPKPSVPPEDIVVPPADARWTIFIAALDGPDHIKSAKFYKSQLAATTHSNKWYVVHEDNKSTIYYGFYRDIDRATKDGQMAQQDKDALAGLKTAGGDTPLSLIYFAPINNAAPEAPVDWDLSKVARDSQHYWTLQIAAYTPDGKSPDDDPRHDRKWAAVETVKDLRAHGVPAYFYHGEVVSSVCVGIWPENAVKRQGGGNSSGNAATQNPNDLLLVADALPSNLKEVRTPDGKLVKTLTPKLEVLDPTMLDMMRQFPFHSRNGYEMEHTYNDQKTKQKHVVRDPSFLALVPESKLAGTQIAPEMQQLQLPKGLLDTGTSQSQPGLGKLRSAGQ